MTVGASVCLYISASFPDFSAAAATRAVVVGPIAPPTDADTDCTAQIIAGAIPREIAAVSCKEPNNILALVLLPVMNAPSTPITDDMKAYHRPASSTIASESIVVMPESIMMDAVHSKSRSVISVDFILLTVVFAIVFMSPFLSRPIFK